MSSPIAGTAPSSTVSEGVRVENVSFTYLKQPVLQNISLSIPRGAFVTLLGPAGCGKTTLLRLIGGYLQPQHGRILLEGKDVTSLHPRERQVGMVFQSYALFPHLTARQNVSFGLEVRGRSTTEVRSLVDATFDRVNLESELRDRFPSQLSGGQQQRVALARALAFQPRLLLLDEPLSNLDSRLRERVLAELCRIHRESHVTSLMVSHNQEEALASSDLVGIMLDGRLLQVGSPRDVYERPTNATTATFLDGRNVIPGSRLGLNAKSQFLIRPERVRIGRDFPGRITSIRFYGGDLRVYVQCAEFEICLRVRPDCGLTVGDAIAVDLPRDALWELPSEESNP